MTTYSDLHLMNSRMALQIAVLRQNFILLTVVFVCVVCSSGCNDGIDSTLDSAQYLAQPVVDALEIYYTANQKYPESLQQLIDSRLLKKLPELPETRKTLEVFQLEYNVVRDGSFCHLSFAYDLQDGFLPSVFSRYRDSDEKVWKTSKYPPSFEFLAARHFGKIYQQESDGDALSSAIQWFVAAKSRIPSATGKNQVLNLLGSGKNIELPIQSKIPQYDELIQYAADCDGGPKYIFAFESSNLKMADQTVKKQLLLVGVLESSQMCEKSEEWNLIYPPAK